MTDRIRRTFDFEIAAVEERNDSIGGLTLEGYAAVFNQWAPIYERGRDFFERIAPGAFKRSISQRMPVMQFDHGQHPLLGSIPIGVPTVLREDEKGLFVRARLSDNWLIAPVRDAIRDGAINGMSFRFSVPEGQDMWERGEDGMERRTIREAIVYELGPVVWPAYSGTEVGVRSELAAALSDETVRADLARLLTFGQRHENPVESEPAREGTSEETPDSPPDSAPVGSTKTERQKAFRLKVELVKELLDG